MYLITWVWIPSKLHAILAWDLKSQAFILQSSAVTNCKLTLCGFHLPVVNLGWPIENNPRLISHVK